MDTNTSDLPEVIAAQNVGTVCHKPFVLGDIQPNKRDKLGNIIHDILWCGTDYAVYRSDHGIYVHFSDCPEREKEQQRLFTEICPELCELRFLVGQARQKNRTWKYFREWLPISGEAKEMHENDALYDHNIAQALMLLMEGNKDSAKEIAKSALDMAVKKSTNDNTIRYLVSCVLSASFWIIIAIFIMFSVKIIYVSKQNTY